MNLKAYHILFCSLISTLLASLCSCSEKADKPTLTVSVEPQRALLEKIVGDKYTVVTLLTNGANPETFEPTVKARMAVDNSDIYFMVGAIPFEHTIEASLADGVKTVDCSAGIEPIYGTHSHNEHADSHEHANVDPHFWVSLRNARIIARTMCNAVVAADPDNADTYRANLAALDNSLAATDSIFAARLADTNGVFAVWHPSLSYFARDYNLQQIAVGFENKDLSPKHLVQVTEQAKNAGVKVFFFQKGIDSRQAQILNNELNARMVTINPLDYNIENELSTIVDELTH